jgi:hypothetical protein
MAKKLVPPYDLGPYASKAAAERKHDQLRALGATCEVVTSDGKFYCRVTKEPD